MARPALTLAEATDAFARVLNIGSFVAGQIIQHLKKDYDPITTPLATTLQELVLHLNSLDMDVSNPTHTEIVSMRGATVNTVTDLAKGGYGTVTISTNDVKNKCVWKEVKITSEQGLRELFLEAFALTVLQADPEFKGSTCGIYGLYRKPDVVRVVPIRNATLNTVRRRASSAGATARNASAKEKESREQDALLGEGTRLETAELTQKTRMAIRNEQVTAVRAGLRAPIFTFLFKLPAYPQTLNDVAAVCCGRNPWKLETMRPLFYDITSILLNLHRKYQFVHNDLHCGNVLFNKKKPVIIDFGRAAFTVEGIRYSAWRHELFDMLLYILHVYSKNSESNAITEYDGYRKLLEMPDITGVNQNILQCVEDYQINLWTREGKAKPIWHAVYTHRIKDLDERCKRALYANEALGPTPNEQRTYLESIFNKTKPRGCIGNMCKCIGNTCTYLPRRFGWMSRRNNSRTLRKSRKTKTTRTTRTRKT